jgi:CO/xanthine dehydrogenase FAD-binding subunit
MKYIPASSIQEATDLVVQGAIVIAGGTILVPEIARSGGAGRVLVDIAGLTQLHEIVFTADVTEFGATVTVDRIASHPRVEQELTALGQAAAAIGNPQVRRAATLGGNVAVASATSDLCPALLSLDAEISCSNSEGLSWFHFDNFLSAKQLITSARIKLVPGRRSAFRKFAWRHASGITIASVAVAVVLQGATVQSARIAVGGVSAKPTLLLKTSAALQGRTTGQETIQEVCRQAAAEALCDLPSPPAGEYRRRLVLAGVCETLGEVFANA